ncbi:MAG TPA: FIST C-terminal domain-containing protein [Novimethylophilus sp.]|jgi:small ligand-binding sensory domain FIST|uniref:FIST C-terminal domain-containing protein n=1 Tax=Novimethylophilus sp. TaxID=2137426 RepID=UPI002F42FBD3
MSVATGLAMGRQPLPELAQNAVAEAMDKAGLRVANSVLLFLTSEFARDPQPALKAASVAASCVQVVGCSAPGIFTDQDWVLDAPAAAAMVFGDGIGLAPEHAPHPQQLLMTLAAPNAINITWLSTTGLKFGGVSGDATGQGPFSVWHNGKGVAAGHCEVALHGAAGAVGATHGVRVLSAPKPVSAGQGHDVIFLGGKPALETLQRAYPGNDALPLHRLMAGITDSGELFKHGDYRLSPLVCANEADRSVTLARRVEAGQLVFWALREADAAEADLDATVTALVDKLDAVPEFGLLFSCLGRGPYFYSGVDRDLELLKRRFPGMPLIGFYGNGEIAPINGVNELLQYSAVLGLFHGAV